MRPMGQEAEFGAIRRTTQLPVNDHLRDSFPDWVPTDHPARTILRRKAGKSQGRIDYKLLDRDDYSSCIPVWETLLGTRLIGIGEVDHGHEQLFLASDGRCFGESVVHDAFYYHAESLSLFQLFRRRSRPMLRPDQQSVDLYGITFTRDSPELYYPFPCQPQRPTTGTSA
jgi:hypothetical protein